jgi:hypothetical protein
MVCLTFIPLPFPLPLFESRLEANGLIGNGICSLLVERETMWCPVGVLECSDFGEGVLWILGLLGRGV